jgi:ABC-type phosphate transport system substrate-binding protein
MRRPSLARAWRGAVIALAAVAVVLVGCGVRAQDEPIVLDRPVPTPAATPTAQESSSSPTLSGTSTPPPTSQTPVPARSAATPAPSTPRP